MTVSKLGRKAVPWLKQASAERRATIVLSQMSTHTLDDIGIDRGGVDYAVRKGQVTL